MKSLGVSAGWLHSELFSQSLNLSEGAGYRITSKVVIQLEIEDGFMCSTTQDQMYTLHPKRYPLTHLTTSIHIIIVELD